MATFVLYDERSRDALVEAIMQVPIDPVRPLTVKTVPFIEPATPKQKSYYRAAVLQPLCAHTGYEEREMHQILVHRFEPEAVHAVDLDVFEINASKAVMSEFIERVIRWASTIDVAIEPPR